MSGGRFVALVALVALEDAGWDWQVGLVSAADGSDAVSGG